MRTAAALLLLAGCTSTRPDIPPPLPPMDGPVAILLHGLHEGPDQFAEDPFRELVAGLEARGWTVRTPSYPEDGPDQIGAMRRLIVDGGYRDLWRDQFAAMIGSGPTIAIGISWGGWHTLAVCDLVDAWAVHVPVTRVSALDEFADLDTSDLDIESVRSPVPGWVRWGTQDDRVRGSLAAGLAGPRVSVEAVEQGHETTPADVAAILAWVDGLGLVNESAIASAPGGLKRAPDHFH